MRQAENQGKFFYGPVQSNQGSTNNEDDVEDDGDNFADAPEISKPMNVSQLKEALPVNPPVASSTISKPPATTETSTISKLIPTDRERSQSPIKPPAPITTAKPTSVAQKTPLTDLDKELQEFDIDLDKDDVSDVEFEASTGAFKKSSEEEEVTR